MDHPLIFGISDAQNIASGAINSAENNQIISVDSEGNVELKDIEDIVNDTDEEEMDEGSEVDLSYIVTKIGGYYGYYEPIWQGYNFSTDTVMDLDWDSDGYYGGAPDVAVGDDPGSGGGEGHGDEIGSTLVVESDIGHIMLAESDIKNVTEVPADGYSYEIHEYNGAYRMEPGKCYALKLRDGNYAVVYFDGFETIKETADEFQETTTLYYKYRNDGGRQF